MSFFKIPNPSLLINSKLCRYLLFIENSTCILAAFFVLLKKLWRICLRVAEPVERVFNDLLRR